MISPSIWAAILLQGAQLTSGGAITGTIRSEAGAPAASVRVVAMAVPNSERRGAELATFESITQTDSNGRYRLENISPGRYYIAAGPVVSQTFHPGTIEQKTASIVMVAKNAPLLGGVDFTLAINPYLSASVTVTTSGGGRMSGMLVMEDKSAVPRFPDELRVVNRRGGGSLAMVGDPQWTIGYFGIPIPPNDPTLEVGLEGLPPGYVLKSLKYGGMDIGLAPFKIDRSKNQSLNLILGYEPVSALKKVTARGKVINPAPELKVTSIQFTSTIPSGPTAVARLQPDGSFEFPDIPVGAYRSGVLDARGSANVSPQIFVIRDNAMGLSIDLRDNPFPELNGIRAERTAFADGKSTEMTGVITEKLTRTGNGDSAYFRMNVKDLVTGVMNPWAVFVEHEWQVPRIIAGETMTVPGTPANDGTNRFSAYPF